jgi:hypothetical protein
MDLNQPLKRSYVHQASLVLDPGADPRAPGAAITVELCGSWEHTPPCPLAPHHTGYEQDGTELRLRTVFAADPSAEEEVRRRIDKALASGFLAGPDGVKSGWSLRSSGPDVPSAAEDEHGQRIADS